MRSGRCCTLGPISRSAQGLALLGLVGGMLVGCGGATQTVSVQGPPTQRTASISSQAGSASASSSTAATGTAAGAEAPTHVVHVEAFQTPTGNIGCLIAAGTARCDIERRSWSPPPRPSSCPQVVSFGQGLQVGSAGQASVVCAGDTVRNPATQKLPYGTATQIGTLECTSRSSGLTCADHQSGHGFLLSVQRYQLF